MAVAIHNYHDAHGTLPPAALRGADGKPLLSWRVLILPYIEQDELYKQFRLDQPWDSPHNIQLLERMPKLYKPYSEHVTTEPGTTYYQVFVGGGAVFGGERNLRIEDISKADGTAYTFLLVE